MSEDAKEQIQAQEQGDTETAGGEEANGATTEESEKDQRFFSEGENADGGDQDQGAEDGDQKKGEEAQPLDLSFMPEELREREELQGYESMDDLLADLKQGRDAREGVPENPEDYKIYIPEGMEEDQNLKAGFQLIAKEMGLNQAQVDQLVDFHNARVDQSIKAQEALKKQGQEFLRKTWGDQYEDNLALADKGMNAFGTQALVDILNTTGLKNHPAMVHTWANIGKAISEDALVLPEEQPKEILRTAGGEPMFDREQSA